VFDAGRRNYRLEAVVLRQVARCRFLTPTCPYLRGLTFLLISGHQYFFLGRHIYLSLIMSDTDLKNVDHFAAPSTEEEAVLLRPDWTKEEELRAKRK
jgi:hypothetical protein